MGGGAFCFKACDPAGANAANYCQHIYDRIGCAYNAPNAAQDGVFVACEGDNQDFPGVYTSNGQVITYSQPPESLGAISTMPYQPRVPASSNCVTYSSAELFASASSAFPTSLLSTTAASATGTGTAKTSGSGSSGSATRSGTSSTATSTANAAVRVGSMTPDNGAFAGAFIALMGMLASTAFLL